MICTSTDATDKVGGTVDTCIMCLHSSSIATPAISATLGISVCTAQYIFRLDASQASQGHKSRWWSRGEPCPGTGFGPWEGCSNSTNPAVWHGMFPAFLRYRVFSACEFHAKFHHRFYNFLSCFAAQCSPHKKGLYTIRIRDNFGLLKI